MACRQTWWPACLFAASCGVTVVLQRPAHTWLQDVIGMLMQGFWTGKLFQTCMGFSQFHGEFESHDEEHPDMEVYDFCAGGSWPANVLHI